MLPLDQKDKLLKGIKDICIENNITLVDVPDFLEAIHNTPIPFGKNSKLGREYAYSDEVENKKSKKSLSSLPDKM